MTNEKIIEVCSAEITYKRKLTLFKSEYYTALKCIDFNVYKGEVLGVIGRNGAGKSSLLKLLSGILKPDSGSIKHHTRKISLLSLQAGFDPNLNGKENIIMGALFLGYSRVEISKMIHEIHEFSELGEFFFKPVGTYSSGMRARLGFSLAMYLSPDVLLVDEVLGVGDVSFKEKANRAISSKLQSDMTVIIVSHSEQQLKKLVDRIIWIDEGIVKYNGEPRQGLAFYNLSMRLSQFGYRIDIIYNNARFYLDLDNFEFDEEKYIAEVLCYDLNNDCSLKEISFKFDNVYELLKEPIFSRKIMNKLDKPKERCLCRFKSIVSSIGKNVSIMNEYGEVVFSFRIVK